MATKWVPHKPGTVTTSGPSASGATGAAVARLGPGVHDGRCAAPWPVLLRAEAAVYCRCILLPGVGAK